ncbi:ATPase component NikO of energizing module of nickel ECF transporter [Paramagnetospirillum magnetotacticum MS-1]|uniref:ATPase component NikO of energizing module of nickel ECF transporter n=1 Tax=Paramagnetospirillum magnetotacticum MS-1 TaxID=272627 RepID=A0A0C2UYU1_PARME|nr:ABC transporter ATP-binding protein [Paramagnetospirillum magnetotacticum]KIL98021.1 ATPase component NikO of energizing module of nickel ECF transporter [Paramagnetospirillum magnetotacticum MS-1]
MTLIRLETVSHAFDAAHPVLDGVDFSLDSGERVALLGANGSGKTTLLHVMVGLIRPQSGRVHAFGRERRAESDFVEVRAKAGLLFQDADDQLFCPTVAEDVAFGPLNLGKSKAEARHIVHAVLDQLGLAALENRVTHKLSGGQKRLVSLAAVLAMEPEALLLDEPTNALDEATRARLLDILAGLPQAMVIVSHDREVIEHLATRRVSLERGILT